MQNIRKNGNQIYRLLTQMQHFNITIDSKLNLKLFITDRIFLSQILFILPLLRIERFTIKSEKLQNYY